MKYRILDQYDKQVIHLLKTTDDSFAEIGRKCGCGGNLVSDLCELANARPEPPMTAAQVVAFCRDKHYQAKAIRMVSEGCELRLAARTCGVKPAVLRTWCKRRKISTFSDRSTVAIYALSCPESGVVRYVGATAEPESRESQHYSKQATEAMRAWISDLRARDTRPVMKIIEYASADNWRERERFWIRQKKSEGISLLNTQGVNA